MRFGPDSAGQHGDRFPRLRNIWPLDPARVACARQKARDHVADPGGQRALAHGREGGGESLVAPPPRRRLGVAYM